MRILSLCAFQAHKILQYHVVGNGNDGPVYTMKAYGRLEV